ncbi:MAG TPA: PPC domain-containing protein, partial [Gaiellaceae bacterium]
MTLLALLALALPATGAAATPTGGTVSPLSPTTAWSGGPFVTSNPAGCATSLDPSCDSFALTIMPPATGSYSVDIVVSTANPNDDDFDLFVYGPSGARVGSSTNGGTPPEKVTLDNPAAGTYRVQVQAWLVNPGATYSGVATLSTSTSAASDTSSVLWSYDKGAAQVSAEAPLRVVMVGFKPGEVDEAAVLGQIPTSQRPGVLIPRADSGAGSCDNENPWVLGASTLLNHGRCYYEGTKPFLVPSEYRWKPKLIYAPDSFADGLFAAMRANSTTGEFTGSAYRPYLEKYNAERGVYRGVDRQVLPGTPVRFVDAEATEEWLAQNSMAALGFDLGPRGGTTIGPGKVPGYTIFVLNTWDSPQALARLAPQHEYHVFRINRIDPDTHEFAGIDWARVWGGKHREVILDLGAAPNPYESETWGNRGRTVFGSAGF